MLRRFISASVTLFALFAATEAQFTKSVATLYFSTGGAAPAGSLATVANADAYFTTTNFPKCSQGFTSFNGDTAGGNQIKDLTGVQTVVLLSPFIDGDVNGGNDLLTVDGYVSGTADAKLVAFGGSASAVVNKMTTVKTNFPLNAPIVAANAVKSAVAPTLTNTPGDAIFTKAFIGQIGAFAASVPAAAIRNDVANVKQRARYTGGDAGIIAAGANTAVVTGGTVTGGDFKYAFVGLYPTIADAAASFSPTLTLLQPAVEALICPGIAPSAPASSGASAAASSGASAAASSGASAAASSGASVVVPLSSGASASGVAPSSGVAGSVITRCIPCLTSKCAATFRLQSICQGFFGGTLSQVTNTLCCAYPSTSITRSFAWSTSKKCTSSSKKFKKLRAFCNAFTGVVTSASISGSDDNDDGCTYTCTF